MSNMIEMCERAKTAGIGEIEAWLKDNKLGNDQAKDLAAFMADAPYPQMIGCWVAVQAQMDNLRVLHPLVSDIIVKRATSAEGT